MVDVRHLWFESHLLSSPSGRAARRRAEALGAARHEAILAHGDRLARHSIAAAQQFYRHAALAVEKLGADFEKWVAAGAALTAPDSPAREAGVAFLSIEPARVARLGFQELEGWIATAARIAEVSHRLAAVFCETTAPLLGEIDVPVLAAWADEGLRLHSRHGWQGELLAQAYFAAAPRALRVLLPEHFALWAGLGAALRRVVKEGDFFGALPESIRSWSPEDRTAFLRAALALAIDATPAGQRFYLTAAQAVGGLPASIRGSLMRICARAGRHAAGAVAEIIPVLGALVSDVPEGAREAAVRFGESVAQRFPRGAVALLRSLPRAFEEADLEGVCRWVERGLELAEASAEVGLAYFALESRTSLKVLRASSTGVTVEEVQGAVRKYVHMLSGEPAVIRAAGDFRLRAPLEDRPEEKEIALPVRVDCLPTHEANERLYRVLAALLAGRREFGTYSWHGDGASGGTPGSALVSHLRSADEPELLEELFLLADGYRVGSRAGIEYPGIKADLERVASELLALWSTPEAPPREVVLDAVLAAAIAGVADESRLPGWLRSAAALAFPFLRPLRRPAASAGDAMAVAEALLALLASSAERGARQPIPYQVRGPVIERLTGDALFDQYADENGTPWAEDAGRAAAGRPDDRLDLGDKGRLAVDRDAESPVGGGVPLSAEELKRLLEAGIDLKIAPGEGDEAEGVGLYLTDLIGKMPARSIEELRRLLGESEGMSRATARRWLDQRGAGQAFAYDEWDYHLADYRPRWCRLREIVLDGDAGVFFSQAMEEYAAIIPEIRRHFERIRPARYAVVRGLEDGEDFDLNAAVAARVETRARRSPSPKLYVARKREQRDVATLFLLDMSASTDEPLAANLAPGRAAAPDAVPAPPARSRRIIDVTKEALAIMAEALEEIGDAYAICGFSGHGRENVEFYLIKSFTETLTPAVKGRIGGIEPKRSTRMGTALRHATEKMVAISAASKHLILLSDGFPQDFDYGQDRRSNVYGIRDTTVALREAEAAGITPFCITVDKAGHDYLREMCDAARYMVIDDIAALPKELPKIYQRVVWAV